VTSKNFKNKALFLLVIFCFTVGIFLRVWKINRVPPELFGDELDVGLQAYSIATTGKDYLGNKLPVMFHSFSEYRLPMQLYFDVPFVKLFGLNEIGVRSPSVFMGFLSLIFIYLLAKEIFTKRLALITTVFLMISPWHFNFSRQANDAGILLPFLLAGTWLFIKGLKNYKYLFASVVTFALSIYSYTIATAFTPLYFLSLVIIFRKELQKYPFTKLFWIGIVGLLLIFPYINFTLKGISTQRFSYISSISEDKLMEEIVAKRRWSKSFLTRALYNKITVGTEIVFKNYSRSMSFNFLFTEGDPNMRQGIEGFGQFYHYDAVLIFLGLIYSFWNIRKGSKNTKFYLLIFLWLLFSPLPSALTKDGGYHASRLILMLPPLILLSALGFQSLIKSATKIKMKALFGVFIIFMLLDFTRFVHRYFTIWPKEGWRFWQTGFKETLAFVKSQDNKYQRIFLNNTYEPMLPRFLFWYGYDMDLFQKQFVKDVPTENIYPGFNGFKLGDKYYFGEILKPVEGLANNDNLIIASGEKDITNPAIFDNGGLELLEVVSSPTKIPIFYVFTTKQTP